MSSANVKHLEENIQAVSSDALESSAACIYENPRLSVDGQNRQDKLAAASPSRGGRERERNKTRRRISRYAQIDLVFASSQRVKCHMPRSRMEPQGCERHRWVKPRGRNERARVSQDLRSLDATHWRGFLFRRLFAQDHWLLFAALRA
jgi:hypothetical protein